MSLWQQLTGTGSCYCLQQLSGTVACHNRCYLFDQALCYLFDQALCYLFDLFMLTDQGVTGQALCYLFDLLDHSVWRERVEGWQCLATSLTSGLSRYAACLPFPVTLWLCLQCLFVSRCLHCLHVTLSALSLRVTSALCLHVTLSAVSLRVTSALSLLQLVVP